MIFEDILTDTNNDLVIENGDFKVGESEVLEVERIICSNKGEWKQFPLLGFGITSWLNGAYQKNVFRRDLDVQLKSDGFRKVEVTFLGGGKVNINADRNG